jgi:preprotein translocase subunit SecE
LSRRSTAPAQEAALAKTEKTVAERKSQNRFQRYIRETMGELRKVSWPTRKEATNLTIVVLIVTFTMSAILGLLDFFYSRLMALILS